MRQTLSCRWRTARLQQDGIPAADSRGRQREGHCLPREARQGWEPHNRSRCCQPLLLHHHLLPGPAAPISSLPPSPQRCPCLLLHQALAALSQGGCPLQRDTTRRQLAACGQSPQGSCQLRGCRRHGEEQDAPKPSRGATPGGIPAVGAAALQAGVWPRPNSSACNWSDFKGVGPQGPSRLQPPSLSTAQQTTAGSALLLEQLGLVCCGGISPPCPAARGAGLTARLSPVSWRGRRCCCQPVSHGTGESGCRIPGAQEGRSQDTQCLQQRSSEANIKGRAGAAGLGSRPSRQPGGNTHTCISQGRGRSRGQPAPRCTPVGCWFPSERAGGLGRPPWAGAPARRGGWGVHGPAVGHTFPSLLCFSRPQTSNCAGRPPSLEHNRPSTVEKQLPGGPGHAGGTVQAGDQSCPLRANGQTPGARQAERQHSTDPFLCTHSPRGRETAANQDTSPERGGRDVLKRALAALTAGSGSVLPHPRALGHNDQVSQHQVCSPTLPACQRTGRVCHRGVKQYQMLPLPVGTAPKLPAGYEEVAGARAGVYKHRPTPSAHTRAPTPPERAQMNPSLQLCPGVGASARFMHSMRRRQNSSVPS